MSEETITFNITVDASDAATNIAELNRLLTTYVSLARRVGLPEDIVDAIAKIQQMRIAIQTLRTSINLLYTATGPIGWALAIGGFALTAFMATDLMETRRSQY